MGIKLPLTVSEPMAPQSTDTHSADLEKVRGEIQSLYKLLPSVTNKQHIDSLKRIPWLENELKSTNQTLASVMAERDHWKSRWEAAAAELTSEREEKFSIECSLQESERRFTQQSEYCASMGSACGTLLWKLSRTDDNIQSLLAGCKVEEFLSLVGSTLLSYTQSYQHIEPVTSGECDDDETQFVLSLCGVLTNIAASAFGRDFLMKNGSGQNLLETLVAVLYDVPVKRCTRVKTLILMMLYNLSINQKGLTLIRSKSGFLQLLVKHIREESEGELRLNSLRLIQSLLYEEDSSSSSSLVREAHEVVTKDFLLSLSKDRCEDIRSAAVDLMNSLRACHIEQ